MYRNKKAFLFKTKEGRHFIAVFVVGTNGKLLGKAIGHRAFPQEGFMEIRSINQITNWLGWQGGHKYIKRLQICVDSQYDEHKMWDIIANFRIVENALRSA